MAFFMDVSDMIADFGESVTIKVWKPSDDNQAYIGGPTDVVDTSDETAEIRHEPVLPINSNSSLGRKIIAGGGQLEGKLVWYSTGDYPSGTIVEVPSQCGYYKVTTYGRYQDYSNFYEYVLDGDGQHGIEE